LHFAGIKDVYTQSHGNTSTTENFLRATFIALKRYYSFLTPDLWHVQNSDRSPMDVHSDFLKNYKEEFEKKRRGRGRGGRGRGGRGRGGRGDRRGGRRGDRRGGDFGTQGGDHTAEGTQETAQPPAEQPTASE
jgi:Ribosomal protein S5, C-terminal domain